MPPGQELFHRSRMLHPSSGGIDSGEAALYLTNMLINELVKCSRMH